MNVQMCTDFIQAARSIAWELIPYGYGVLSGEAAVKLMTVIFYYGVHQKLVNP